MKFVITGSTSFLGKVLIRRFVGLGHKVYAVGRSDKQELPENIDYAQAQMLDYKNLDKIIPNADVFINLAWEGTGHDGRFVKEIQESNIKHSLEALASAKRMGCHVFIESGSQAEYGITTSLTSEDSPCRPFSEYGKAKLDLQKRAFEISKKLGISYIHLRIYSMIGENDHPWTLVSSAIDKMLRNENLELTSCTQLWNYLYVNDAVDMIANISEYYFHDDTTCQEIFNIASDDTRELKEFVEEIKHLTCSKSTCLYGAKKEDYVVSLNPDISKYKNTIGPLRFTPFDSVITKILQK